MTIPTSPGKLIAIAFLIAGLLKMSGVVPMRLAAADLFLAGILTAAVIP
jgi:hypothetical protein